MIWGKTEAQKQQERQEWLAARYNKWYPFFALRPRQLIDGRWAWLMWIEVKLPILGSPGLFFYSEAHVDQREFRAREKAK